MHKLITLGLAILGSGMLAGCATVLTHKADLSQAPKGVRVYPPKVYLMVDTGEKKTTLAYMPDYARAYDVRPVTFFAKQDFKIEFDEGQLKSLTANQDTTAILSLIKEAETLAAKAAGVAVSSSTINGTFGFESGIYCLEDDGVFRKINKGCDSKQ